MAVRLQHHKGRTPRAGALAEAISAAAGMGDPFGRSGLVYAVTAEGREAVIDRVQWAQSLQG